MRTLPDYQLAEACGLELDYGNEKGDFRDTNFPARFIYERVLPEVVEAHSNIFYHRASPYSGSGKPTTDRTLGDIHQCVPRRPDFPCIGANNFGRECMAWFTRAVA